MKLEFYLREEIIGPKFASLIGLWYSNVKPGNQGQTITFSRENFASLVYNISVNVILIVGNRLEGA